MVIILWITKNTNSKTLREIPYFVANDREYFKG